MNDDLFEGPLLCRKPLFRSVSANSYSPTDVDAATHDRRPVKLRWAAYTDRQRRVLQSLLDPDANAEAMASRQGDVHVYTLSTDGDAKPSKTATTTADEETTTADEKTTTTAHKGTNTSQMGPAVAQKATTTEEPEEDEDHVGMSAENSVRNPTDGDGEDEATAGSVGVSPNPAAEVGPGDGDPNVHAGPTTEDDEDLHDSRCHRPHNSRRSCVDLKGLAKLRKLCCLLRANVAELRHAYESRCDGDGPAGRASYTASEHQTIADGLRALRADVSRLVCEVQEASGYRDEIADAVVCYKNYESRYRSLRTLNKNALSRTYTAAPDDVPVAENARADDVRDCDADADNHVLKRWLRKYLCDPCYRLFKRFMPSE